MRAQHFLALVALVASSCGGGKNYLSAADLAAVANNRPDYEWACAQVNLPWKALAAVHYRESGFLRRVKALGGPFMLDCGGSRQDFATNIRTEERRVARLYCYPDPHGKVRDDFRFACLVAAHELLVKCRGEVYGWFWVNGNVVADAMWGYNGRTTMCTSWRKSAYVNNDPANGRSLTVCWWNDENTMMWVRDTRPGAYIIYRELCRRVRGGSIKP